MPPAGHLLSPATESAQRTPPKSMFFGFLTRALCGMYRGLSTLRIKQFKSVSCFRIVSSSIHRDTLHACAARPNRAALCVYRAARCGERIERRRWRMKRDERVAAVKILSVRRKAAQKFWAPQQGHRALRISIAKRCVGDDAYIVPPPPHFLCRGIPLILFILSHFSKNARLPL